MFLPHLNSLALTDVDMETLVNVSCFCPQLLSLAISKSEVMMKKQSDLMHMDTQTASKKYFIFKGYRRGHNSPFKIEKVEKITFVRG